MPDVLVNAPLGTVFKAASDLARHAEWAQHDIKIEETDDSRLAVGKTYPSAHSKAKAADRLEVSTLVENDRFGFAVTMANDMSFVHTMKFVDQGGGTLVTRDVKRTNAPGFNKSYCRWWPSPVQWP